MDYCGRAEEKHVGEFVVGGVRLREAILYSSGTAGALCFLSTPPTHPPVVGNLLGVADLACSRATGLLWDSLRRGSMQAVFVDVVLGGTLYHPHCVRAEEVPRSFFFDTFSRLYCVFFSFIDKTKR